MNNLNSSPQLSSQELVTITNFCRQFTEIESVTLFGSRAKGNATPRSDIDLALTGAFVTRQIIGSLKALFEESNITVSVDILDIKQIDNPALLDHITRCGIPIFTKGS